MKKGSDALDFTPKETHTMPTSPCISLILPIYQVEDYIEDCLRSICEQEADIELILIDDCGGDRSIERAHRYLDAHWIDRRPYISLTHEQNRGLSAGRNTGIAAATGDYIYFLDSDDCLLPDALQKLLSAATEHESAIALGCIDQSSGGEWGHRLPVDQALSDQDAMNAYWRGDYYPMACNKLISREFLIQHKLFFTEGLLHEDELWSMQVAFTRPRIIGIPDLTYWYRLEREGSITNAKGQDRAQIMRRAEHVMRIFIELVQLGEQHHALSNTLYRQALQAWEFQLLFIKPLEASLSPLQTLRHYKRYVSCYPRALIAAGGKGAHIRIGRAASLCKYPTPIATALLYIYSRYWLLRKDAQLKSILNYHKNNSEQVS